ncbi:Panacea domain-containing protein [Tautonia rosea]|uniref:Panacea domain-containing protein n=1 Tax=Tautonia rosea TaxID=2728037 RepID=UPI00147616A6|nr:type II toxin-antitoxin system antitoxin SocA domain-containing protein [Tautonia rosea]
MSYSAKTIANYFLGKSFENEISVSPMKLQKLVYYAHGWHLGLTGRPLIDEQIEAWPYGPVVDSLFHEFKDFGKAPIDRFATEFDFQGKRGGIRIVTPELPPADAGPSEAYVRGLLDRVWSAYGQYSAEKLSNMTHAAGSPWQIVCLKHKGRIPRNTDIPIDLIREHFREAIGKATV